MSSVLVCPFAKICQSKFYHFPNVTSMYPCQPKATKWATLSHQSTYLPIKMLYFQVNVDLAGYHSGTFPISDHDYS